METRAFREVLTLKMDSLFQAIVDNPKSPLIYIPQHFLGSNLQPNTGGAAGNQAAIGRVFADILLTFLTRRLRDMSVPFTESAQNAAYVHLFRHVFASVEVNDVVLRPYIAPIVTSILRLVSEVKNPINYFAILRALFRSIGGGKFELLYKEFLPTLGDLVGTLMRMQTKGPPATREIALELSLTLPARLSSLLAYIPILIRAVLRAFQSREDTIVKLGLRTLDFWVDNLNPDYLYPHCRPLLNELFTGLCALLRPQPYSSYGSQALSVLGKFGGKNRRFLIEGVELAWKERKEEGLTLAAEWLQPAGQQGDAEFALPMGRTIDIAYKMVTATVNTNSYSSSSSSSSSSAFAAESSLQCFHFLRTCLLALLDTSGDVNAVWVDGGYRKYQPYNTEWQAEQQRFTEEKRRAKEDADKDKQRTKDKDREQKRERDKAKLQRRGNKAALKQLQEEEEREKKEKEAAAAASLAARNAPPTAAAIPPPTPLPALNEDELLSMRYRILSSASHSTCKQLVAATIIAAADGVLMRQGADALDFVRGLCMHFAAVCASGREKPQGEGVDGMRDIDCSVFVEAVVDVMADETQERRDMAYACLSTFLTSLIQLVGVDAAGERGAVSDLLSALCHCCHLERWEAKQAGCLGLSLLCASLSSSWIIGNQMELIKSLMATYTDEKQQHTEATAEKATSALQTIIAATCQHARVTMQVGKDAAVGVSETGDSEERKAIDSGVSVMEVVSEQKEFKEERKEEAKEETKEEEKKEQKEQPAEEMKEMDIQMQTEDDNASTKASDQSNGAAVPTTVVSAAAVAASAPRVVLDERNSPPLRHLIAIVAPCLISNGSAMRQAAQQLLAFISQQTNRSLFDLLYPHREHLLQHVYSKALHTLSIAVRIGHLSAASYLLTLSPQPLVSGERLSYLVKVVMDVVDEEQHLTGNFNSRTGRAQLWTKLRVESLHLMSAALAHEDVRRDPKQHREWKEQVIKIFFRNLLSRNPDINSAAKAGLHAVLLKEKIPKELLQLCLRPILLNLADHRKLSVALLEGLARLLELLSSCFNVTLGEKLLDHLKHFSTVEGLTRMREEAQQDKTNTLIRLKPDEEVKIPLCVIELFHLLPPAPEGKFLEALIGIVLRLEEVLPLLMCGGLAVLGPTQVGPNCSVIGAAREKEREREREREKEMGVSSPYRLPLLKFLNKTPKKSLEYLLRSLHRKRVSALLLSLLRLPEAEPLRDYMYQHPEFLTLWTFHYDKAVAEATLMPPASSAQQAAQPQNQPPAASATADTAGSTPAAQAEANGPAATANGTSSPPLNPPPLDQPPTFSSTPDANATPATDNGAMPPLQPQSSSSTVDTNMPAADGQSATAVSPAPSTATANSASPAQSATTVVSASNAASAITPAAAAELEERTVQGVSIVHVLSSHNPQFIGSRVIKCLLDVWDSKQRITRLLREETLPIHYVDETRLLVLSLLAYSKQHRDDVHVMWKLLSAFRIRSLVDLTFLADYLDVDLSTTYSTTEKRRLLREILKYVDSNTTSSSSKSRAFKHVIRPMIKHWLRNRPARSVQEVKDEQMRLVNERRGGDVTTGTAERKESGSRSMDDSTDQLQSTDGKTGDMEDKAAETADDSSSFGSGSGDSTQTLPPVWLEDDLLDTDMADCLMRALSAEHSSLTQDEVSTTAHTHAALASDDDKHIYSLIQLTSMMTTPIRACQPFRLCPTHVCIALTRSSLLTTVSVLARRIIVRSCSACAVC